MQTDIFTYLQPVECTVARIKYIEFFQPPPAAGLHNVNAHTAGCTTQLYNVNGA
jgi:hypothetical protein